MNLANLITDNHLDTMNKLILAMSCIMGYAYVMEGGTAWYSANPYIQHTFKNYVSGFYGWAGITTITCNIIIPQIFWFRRMRRSIPAMICVALAVTLGMWMERFVIIIISLHQDYLPSSWHTYIPTKIDFGVLLGSFGLFFTLVLLFARVLPVIATSEMKTSLPGAQAAHGGSHE
jgi:molybdopterin-containing oxidoreductase family membrane subunit